MYEYKKSNFKHLSDFLLFLCLVWGVHKWQLTPQFVIQGLHQVAVKSGLCINYQSTVGACLVITLPKDYQQYHWHLLNIGSLPYNDIVVNTFVHILWSWKCWSSGDQLLSVHWVSAVYLTIIFLAPKWACLWVNNSWGQRPNGLLTQSPWEREK